MVRLWNDVCAVVGDATLSWLLCLPRDATLLLLAALTATFLLLLRRFVSNQPALRCAARDNRRLRRLIRRARRRGDRESVQRYRRTRAGVARIRLAAEIRPALLGLLPLSMIVTWAAAQLPYYPPASGSWIQLTAYTSVTEEGHVVHLVPHPSIQTREGWLRAVGLGERDGRRRGLVTWEVSCAPPPTEVQLQIRLGAETICHQLRVGHLTYTPPIQVHESDRVTHVQLASYRPFGWVPDTRWLPAWAVAYLVLTAAFFFLAKLALRVA